MNEDTGANAEDEGMPSQEEQYDELENVSQIHPLQLLQILYRHLRPLPVPTRREEKGSPRTRRLGPAHFALSRAVVQESPGVQLQHRSRVAHASYASPKVAGLPFESLADAPRDLYPGGQRNWIREQVK